MVQELPDSSVSYSFFRCRKRFYVFFACLVENAFIFGLAYILLPDDEKALAWPLRMKVQSYSDGKSVKNLLQEIKKEPFLNLEKGTDRYFS